jgi:glyoxylase-like metal-dependent hydrolase (beta-lactamase superfamily II)
MTDRALRLVTRRDALRAATAVAGGMVWTRLFPRSFTQQPTAPPAERLAAFRAQIGAAPIQAHQLAENLTMLSGPGGNVVVLHGSDGKLVVDTFVRPAWPRLKETLAGIGSGPVHVVIDTHWHLDHADNNAPLRAAGATVVAHENTKRRLSERHHLAFLELDVPPSPATALPQQTFADSHALSFGGETLALAHFAPAHTDTDIYVHFPRENVLHVGDVFFNGRYPFIDGSTGGAVNGMVAAADKALSLADNDTKIVPGHGALATKADLATYRDMLATARDRVQKLKSAGKSMAETVAAKPFADLEATWGKGRFNGDTFVQIVYTTL